VPESPVTLGDLSELVRSKNAGPFWLTFDVFLRDGEAYRTAVTSGSITPDAVAKAYDVPADTVQIFELPSLEVIKVSFPRPVSQGSTYDRDMHAGQQHVPLAGLLVASSCTS
jgi:hypothetical protein